MKQTIRLAALALLLAVATTACTSKFEIAGSAWGGSLNMTENDGEDYTTTFTLVLNSSNSGMLFVSVDYGEPMTECVAMPVSYTWDGESGTANATLNLPGEPSQTFVIPLSYSKSSGLTADLSRMGEDSPISTLTLKKASFSQPASMVGTKWKQHFTEEEFTYTYELNFTNATSATLNLDISEGDEPERYHWNVAYSYLHGIGSTTIVFDGEQANGGFYMPDDNHLLFSDGGNGLLMTLQK